MPKPIISIPVPKCRYEEAVIQTRVPVASADNRSDNFTANWKSIKSILNIISSDGEMR